MRFENIELEELESDIAEYNGSYIVPATDELIDITNKLRIRNGNTDLPTAENDVYYTYYLCFNADKREVTLNAVVAHGEKDDFKWYTIELLPEEKEMLMWKVIKELLEEQFKQLSIHDLEI